MRRCPTTGTELPPIDLSRFRWPEIAAEVREAETTEAARLQKRGADTPVPTRTASRESAIPPPDEAFMPMRVNVYDFGRTAGAALSPLFPYFTEGCIVPCVAVQDLSDRGERGYFVHFNTVQEVNVCFGARGSSYLVSGGVSVGPTTHPVGDKHGQAPNPELMVIAVITQRQAVAAPQREAMIFMCEQCGEETFRNDYEADAFPDPLEGPIDSQIIGLPTISQSAASSQLYNQNEGNRVCKKCGHLNAPFPDAYWGWAGYRRRTRIAVEARKIMGEASAAGAGLSVAAE